MFDVELVVAFVLGFVTFIHSWMILFKSLVISRYESIGNPQTPSVSVIVCARNELDNLKKLIPILKDQDYEHFDIWIILDRCTDRSKEFLKKMENLNVVEIHDVPEGWNPKKWALQNGISSSQNEWLLLTDADCRPTKSWISEMSAGMRSDRSLVLGVSPFDTHPGFLNQFIQYETFLTSLEFVSQTLKDRTYMGLGRNMAYRKSVFESVNGFSGIEHVTGGDDDLLVQRMAKHQQASVILSKESLVETYAKTSWSTYLNQKTRHYSVGKYYDSKVKRRESIRWSVQFLFWPLVILNLVLNPLLGASIFVLSYFVRIISINIVANRLEKRFNHLWLPFVDLVYAVLLPLISLRSLVIKNIKWN